MTSRNLTPKLSIVTPSYNSGEYIEEAIQSVLDQDYENFEHIIVDGNSTDSTPDILERYDHLRVIREPDEGIYNALNKGIRYATGDFIGWLNADDKYTDDAFEVLINEYNRKPNCSLIVGSCEKFTIDNGEKKIIRTHKFSSEQDFREGKITHSSVLLNGCLFKKELINEVGAFDESFQFSGDFDYLIRLASKKPIISRTEKVVYQYRIHADSITWGKTDWETKEKVRKEDIKLLLKNMSQLEITDDLYRYCINKFRSSSLKLSLVYLHHAKLATAGKVALTAFQHDRLWPVWAMKKSAKHIQKILYNSLQRRSD